MNGLSTMEPGLRPRRRADEDDEEGFEGNFFPVTYTPTKAGVYKLYIFGPIIHASQFIPHIEALEAAGENDTVVINLSTPGGSLNATDTFLTAMHECEGRVIVRASGGVHSAGSVILLHADEFTLSPNFNCLIHNGSFGTGGDYNKAVASAKHSQEYMEHIMRTTYEGFLTPDELNAMIEGKDFWLGPKEFSDRWERRNEYMMTKLNELEQFVQAEQEVIEVTPRPPRKRKPKQLA